MFYQLQKSKQALLTTFQVIFALSLPTPSYAQNSFITEWAYVTQSPGGQVTINDCAISQTAQPCLNTFTIFTNAEPLGLGIAEFDGQFIDEGLQVGNSGQDFAVLFKNSTADYSIQIINQNNITTNNLSIPANAIPQNDSIIGFTVTDTTIDGIVGRDSNETEPEFLVMHSGAQSNQLAISVFSRMGNTLTTLSTFVLDQTTIGNSTVLHFAAGAIDSTAGAEIAVLVDPPNRQMEVLQFDIQGNFLNTVTFNNTLIAAQFLLGFSTIEADGDGISDYVLLFSIGSSNPPNDLQPLAWLFDNTGASISDRSINKHWLTGSNLQFKGVAGFAPSCNCRSMDLAFCKIDSDGDGLFDYEEVAGEIDDDCDGTPDLNLPFGVNPNHKDMLVELDWMTGEEPTAGQIAAIKNAFAQAPVDAGGIANPDGQLGITLWIDTGALVDPTTGSFVGDNLGGGNAIPPQNVSRLDARFNGLKNGDNTVSPPILPNFNPVREKYFRYGISARPAIRDPLLGEFGAGPGTCQDPLNTDEDGDGLANALDPDCAVDPFLQETGGGPGSCQDGIDNNPLADGADIADTECQGLPQEAPGVFNSCYNNFDDNGDGNIDGADPLCPGIPIEDGSPLGNSCTDGIDNGGGDQADANDPDCAGLPTEDGAAFLSCWDNIDNGSDGLDGTDTSCTYAGGWGNNVGFLDFNHDPGTVMHELGHMLGLDHGGPVFVDGVAVPNNAINCKPNYISIMNYDHQFGILQAYRPNSPEDGVANGCNDGIDNNLDGTADILDPDCRLPGSDLNGDGTPDGAILDFSPPRTTGGRGQDLTNLSINELALNESIIIDAFDTTNMIRFVDANGNKIIQQANGFNPLLSEGGLAAPGSCGDIGGLDEDGDGVANFFDPQCRGQDYDANATVTNGLVATALNINTAGLLNGIFTPPGCANNLLNETLNGANDWQNISLPTSGRGSPVLPQFEPELPFQPHILQQQLTAIDLSLTFPSLDKTVSFGTPSTLKLTVVNAGPTTAKSIAVTIMLSEGLDFSTLPASCSRLGNQADCLIPKLHTNNLHIIEFDVTPTLPAPVSGNRRIEASVTTPGGFETQVINNKASMEIIIQCLQAQFTEPPRFDWGYGYCVDLLMTNACPTPLDHWRVSFDTHESTIYDDWNGSYSSKRGLITVTPKFDWSQPIMPYETLDTIGFCANRDIFGFTLTPTITTPTPGPQNLLTSNGNFAAGQQGFEAHLTDASVTWNDEANFDIHSPSNEEWQVQLLHKTSVIANQEYSLCYKAKANSPRTITADIDDGEPNFQSLTNNAELVNLTSGYQQFQHKFTVNQNKTGARVKFDLGSSDIGVQIDDVGLYKGKRCGQP